VDSQLDDGPDSGGREPHAAMARRGVTISRYPQCGARLANNCNIVGFSNIVLVVWKFVTRVRLQALFHRQRIELRNKPSPLTVDSEHDHLKPFTFSHFLPGWLFTAACPFTGYDLASRPPTQRITNCQWHAKR
jgi:hypothetical protein